jgi:hypothetical protein
MNRAAGLPSGGGGMGASFSSTMSEKAMKIKPSSPPAMLVAIFMILLPFLGSGVPFPQFPLFPLFRFCD